MWWLNALPLKWNWWLQKEQCCEKGLLSHGHGRLSFNIFHNFAFFGSWFKFFGAHQTRPEKKKRAHLTEGLWAPFQACRMNYPGAEATGYWAGPASPLGACQAETGSRKEWWCHEIPLPIASEVDGHFACKSKGKSISSYIEAKNC